MNIPGFTAEASLDQTRNRYIMAEPSSKRGSREEIIPQARILDGFCIGNGSYCCFRGSDGKWYYSTYHFCVEMIVLRDMLDQPENLAKFRNECALREFDGHSDACLETTWPSRK